MKAELGSKIALSKAYGAENVDLPLAGGDTIRFGDHALTTRATPGHTAGCLSLVIGDGAMVFSGDALLVRSVGRTDFQEGDARQLFRSIKEQLFTLPDDCLVYPAHDYEGRTMTTIREERLFNPRIGGGAKEEDFVGYMANLGLPHPKQIAVALPANLRSGRPERGDVHGAPDWGPVVTTYAGLREIPADWVASHRSDVNIVDVRSVSEFDGELGHIEGAQLIPLGELRTRTAEVSTEKPVVVVCQTGKRSGMGSVILQRAGVARVANLAGGMVRWRELGLPTTPPTCDPAS
jgi:rhodanese-related sulfurtransferase